MLGIKYGLSIDSEYKCWTLVIMVVTQTESIS